MNKLHSRLVKVLTLSALTFSLIGIGARSASAVGFPATSCRPGFQQIGQRLCISISAFNERPFDEAMRTCRNSRARVATYGDLYYLYKEAPSLAAAYDPFNHWMGEDLVSDNGALAGNDHITSSTDSDIKDFEGVYYKGFSRPFWCAHDRE